MSSLPSSVLRLIFLHLQRLSLPQDSTAHPVTSTLQSYPSLLVCSLVYRSWTRPAQAILERHLVFT